MLPRLGWPAIAIPYPIKDFLGRELSSQALDQLVLAQQRRGVGVTMLAQLIGHVEGLPTEAAKGALNQLPVGFSLLLHKGRIRREGNHQTVAVECERAGRRERCTEHPVLLGHGLGHRRPDRLQLIEFERAHSLRSALGLGLHRHRGGSARTLGRGPGRGHR